MKRTTMLIHLLWPCLVAGGAWAEQNLPSPTVHRVAGGATEVHANAYVIEGENGLVLVDALLTRQGGEIVGATIRDLEKPLRAVVLTHGHPDHYGGLTTALAGMDVPIYAVRGVDDVIRRDDALKGEALATLGIPWPEKRTFPTEIVENGETLTFGAISLTVREIGPAESDFDSVWTMESAGETTVFLGDLLTVNEHVYTADGHTRNWIEAIARLQQKIVTDAVLYVGHGEPITPDEFAWVAEYLERYRAEADQLAQGGVRLTRTEKEVLRDAMVDFAGNDINARWVIEGADAVAQEIANQERREFEVRR